MTVSSSLLGATMNQPSSVREDPQSVSGVLTADNAVNKLGRYDVRQNSSPCLERGVGARRT
ncbi:protein of unknown function [Methylorubrum extorquens]|uniref:Uncharacterized protein n=1 Tax=Methylorubrum extorquens TaxID=408 RepID=A0A2N9AXH9_METEX|nr:protein of unknown function [Methylorubrum extorquens]